MKWSIDYWRIFFFFNFVVVQFNRELLSISFLFTNNALFCERESEKKRLLEFFFHTVRQIVTGGFPLGSVFY